MEKIGRTKIVDLLKRTDIGAMDGFAPAEVANK